MTLADRQRLSIGKARTLAEVAYEEMLRLINQGTWAPRMRLPSEAELAEQFSMSRPVIRQALSRLRDRGLIQSRQGSGSFVIGTVASDHSAATDDPSVNFPSIASLADLDSFLNFREGLEVEASATAARKHNAAQLRDLWKLVDHAGDGSFAQTDYQFHLAVAAASNNVFYVNTLVSLKRHLLVGLELEWTLAGSQTEFREQVALQHADIVSAIERRDGEAARGTMRKHLQWARTRLVTGSGAMGPDDTAVLP